MSENRSNKDKKDSNAKVHSLAEIAQIAAAISTLPDTLSKLPAPDT